MPKPIPQPAEFEAYQEYALRLSGIKPVTVRQIAAMLTVHRLLAEGTSGMAMADVAVLTQRTDAMRADPAFKELMRDPEVNALVEQNDMAALNAKLRGLEREREQYARPVPQPQANESRADYMDRLAEGDLYPGRVAAMLSQRKPFDPVDPELLRATAEKMAAQADNAFRLSATDRLRKQAAAEREGKRGARYDRMMRQLERAQLRAARGVPTTGEQARQLIDAVMACNDNGKRVPGGVPKATCSLEAMCILSNYMPVDEFRAYCESINKAHGAEDPRHPRHEDAERYAADRLTGGAATAGELYAELRARMIGNATPGNCAEAVAIRQLSGGDPGRLVRRSEISAVKRQLLSPDSAFQRSIADKAFAGETRSLGEMGEAAELAERLARSARLHTARRAQWEVNASIRALTGEERLNRYYMEEHLANILAARAAAAQTDVGVRLSGEAFRERAERLKEDPAFLKLADRYERDPEYRRQINEDLSVDHSAMLLRFELHRFQTEPQQQVREAKAEAVRRQEERQREEARQAEQRLIDRQRQQDEWDRMVELVHREERAEEQEYRRQAQQLRAQMDKAQQEQARQAELRLFRRLEQQENAQREDRERPPGPSGGRPPGRAGAGAKAQGPERAEKPPRRDHAAMSIPFPISKKAAVTPACVKEKHRTRLNGKTGTAQRRRERFERVLRPFVD